MNKKLLIKQLEEVLQSGIQKPYTFRTRLERLMIRLIAYIECGGVNEHRDSLCSLCQSIMTRINYISDKSNQNSEGELNSYSYFKNDLRKIEEMLKRSVF